MANNPMIRKAAIIMFLSLLLINVSFVGKLSCGFKMLHNGSACCCGCNGEFDCIVCVEEVVWEEVSEPVWKPRFAGLFLFGPRRRKDGKGFTAFTVRFCSQMNTDYCGAALA